MNNSMLKENSILQNSQSNASFQSFSRYGTPINRSPNMSMEASNYSLNLGNRKSEYKIDPGKTLQESQQRVVLLACEVERLGEVNIKLVKENEILRATNEKSQREKDLEFKLALVLAENEKLNEIVEKLNQTPEQLDEMVKAENQDLRQKIHEIENKNMELEDIIKQIGQERDRLKAEKRIAEEQFNGMRMKINEIIGQNYILNQEKQKLLKAIQELDEVHKNAPSTPGLKGSFTETSMASPDQEEKVKRAGVGQSSEAQAKLRTMAEEIAKYRRQVADLENENQSLKNQAEKGRELEESCNKLREIVDQLAPKAQQADQLVGRVFELESENANLKGTIEMTKEGIESAKRAVEKASGDSVALEQRNAQVELFKKEVERLNILAAKLTLELEEKGKRNEALQKENERINGLLAKLSHDSDERGSKVDVLIKENERLGAALNKATQDLDDQRFKNGQLTAQLLEKKGIENQLSSARDKYSSLSAQNEDLIKRVMELETENHIIPSMKEHIQILLEDSRQLKETLLENASLKKKFENLNNELKAVTEDRVHLMNSLSDKSKELESKAIEIKTQAKKIEDLQALLQESEKNRELHLAAATDNKNLLEKARQKVEAAVQEAEDAKKQLEQAQQERDNFCAIAGGQQHQLQEDLDRLKLLNDKVLELQGKLTKSEEQRDQQAAIANQAQKSLDESQVKIAELTKNFEEVQVKLSEIEKVLISQITPPESEERVTTERLTTYYEPAGQLEEPLERILRSSKHFTNEKNNLENVLKNREMQINDLVNQVQDLLNDKSALQDKLREAEQNFTDNQQSLLEGVSTEIQQMNRSIEDLKKLLDQTTAQLEGKNKEVEVKNQELDAKTKTLEEKIKEIEAKTQEIDSKNKEIEALTNDNNALGQEINNLIQQISKLNQEINDKSKDIQNKEDELGKAHANIQHLMEDLEQAKPQIAQSTTSEETKNSFLEARSIPIQDIINGMDQTQAAELEETKKKLALAFDDNAFLTKRVVDQDSEIEKLKKQVTDLRVENSLIPGLEMRNRTVHEELQKALKDIEDLRNDSQRQRRRSIDYSSNAQELDKCRQQVQILLEENEKLNSNLEKQFGELEQMRKKLLEAERSALLVEPLQEKVNKLIADLASRSNEIEQLKKKIEELEPKGREAEDYKRQLNAQISDNARLFEENQALKRDLDSIKSLPNDPIALAEEKKQLNVKVLALADEVSTLNDVLSNELFEKEKTRALIENIAVECEAYKKKIVELATENENLASNLKSALDENEKMFKTPRLDDFTERQLQAKINFLNVDIAAQNNIIDGLKRKIEENQKLADESEANKLAVSILKKEKDHMSRLLHDKLVEIEGLKGQILDHARGNSGMEQLQQKVKTYSDEVQKLNEVLLRKAKECESLYEEVKKSKSTVGEAETLKMVNNMLTEENMKLRNSNAEIMVELNTLKKKIGENSYRGSTTVSPANEKIKTLTPGYGEKRNF